MSAEADINHVSFYNFDPLLIVEGNASNEHSFSNPSTSW